MTVVEHPIEFFGVDALQDPYPLYDRLRAGGPVHRIGESGFYVVCSWEAINRPDDFSSNLTATMMFTAEGTVVPFELDGLGGPTQILATADDPAHVEHRKMLVPLLAAKRIRSSPTPSTGYGRTASVAHTELGARLAAAHTIALQLGWCLFGDFLHASTRLEDLDDRTFARSTGSAVTLILDAEKPTNT